MLRTLLPQFGTVVVESVDVERDMLVVTARTRAAPAECPACGQWSAWERSRYVRHLGDEAVGGRAVRIDISVRRLYCENAACPKVTFAEQVGGLTVRYQRRTPALQRVVETVAVALAGSAGARLLVHLHQRVSWSTLLRCVMALPDPPAAVPQVLGVDDFALLRGQSYGTILVDTLTRLPIEVWEGRTAETLSEWQRAHPGVQVVCRDGSEVYRAGITAGAPEAVQVSDRFHLWQGLTRRVRDVVAAHRACLTPPPRGTVPMAGPDPETVAHNAVPPEPTGRAADRARGTHTAIHDLLAQGMGLRAVARQLGIGRKTVQRYARVERWQDKVPLWPRRPSLLDPHRDYLLRRWDEGEHSSTALHREITARGYTGSYGTVRDFLAPHRAAERGHPAGPVPQPAAPGVLEMTRWLTCRPENLTEDQRTQLKKVLARCPELEATDQHVRAFGTLLTSGTDNGLDTWIDTVRASGLPALHSFARGLAADLDAVRSGLTLTYNSGINEGRVTDLKLIKRQMGGRARIPLLRKRVLLVAASRRTAPPTAEDPSADPWLIRP
ncbi:ISL3 family transposase [Streptomyces sp. NBC_00536]|uniref:ISL3 family transposase n=1 Tax=Streptomyces sp. NBC_00536 TaxID=2975769 RepID=UPI002E804478|nr:ISL3 family transposase [Streptomyces sp. NBC_00536]WUC83326.1 ISL3 family transposase [Streptomyces sp. NBC_00536]